MLIFLITLLACAAGTVLGWVLASQRGRTLAGVGDVLALAETQLAPVRHSLGAMDEHLRALETARASAYAGLTAQVGALRAETGQLVTALRAPHTRGRWGEMTLRRVVEAAGALEHCHFSEQQSGIDAHGAHRRPDLVVHLADGKEIAVDCKVPFLHYLEAMEARDDTARTLALRAHALAVRGHVRALADKEYWRVVGNSPEVVVLFIPADAFLDAALQQDPGLLDDAFARDIVLATPSTLVALLRTVAYCWRSERLSHNAAEVAAAGREVYERLATMGAHLDRLGGALSRAVRAYNETLGSLESRVLVSARKLADLDVSGSDLPGLEAVSDAVRPLTAPELIHVV